MNDKALDRGSIGLREAGEIARRCLQEDQAVLLALHYEVYHIFHSPSTWVKLG